jgi:hypothetical protein
MSRADVQAIDCKEWDGDEDIPLDRLAQLIPELQHRYGKKALVRLNAGANNVQVEILPTKVQRQKAK